MDPELERIVSESARLVRWARRLAIVATVFAVAAVAVLVFARWAHADPRPGLWQEAVVIADGVTVRKIRDNTGGDSNICYVASRLDVGLSPSDPRNAAVAISCVPERKP